MHIIGADPGLGGALALLDSNLKLIDVIDTPSAPKSATKNWLDVGKLNSVIQGWLEIDNEIVAGIENVHAMPGQGVSSMFTFGESLGALRAVIVCNGIPIHWVTPQSWKKAFSLTSEKKVATAKACNFYPQHTDLLVTPRGRCLDGRAEAILIARFIAGKL